MPVEANALGDFPEIAKTAYIHPTATIIGKVCLRENVFVGPNAVIRADEPGPNGQVEPIIINECVNIQDAVVIHALGGSKVVIGAGTSIAHASIIHGPCRIGPDCFIGFNSIVFRAILESNVIVLHQASVENVTLPSGFMVTSGVNIENESDLPKLKPLTEQWVNFARKVSQTNLQLVKNLLKL